MTPADLPPFLAAALGIAQSRGGSSFSPADLAAALRSLPSGEKLGDAAAAFLEQWLVEHDWLTRSGSTLSLTEQAITALSIAPMRVAAIAPEDMNAVTRRFIEEVLAGAEIPDELIENIIRTYVERGTLRMSEDGGRSIIELS